LSCTAYSSLSLSSSRRTVWAFDRRSRLGLSVAPPFGLECLTSLADCMTYYARC